MAGDALASGGLLAPPLEIFYSPDGEKDAHEFS